MTLAFQQDYNNLALQNRGHGWQQQQVCVHVEALYTSYSHDDDDGDNITNMLFAQSL